MQHVLTILAVDDVAATAAFYDRAFGWARSVDVPVYVEYTVTQGSRIGLYNREAFAANTGVRPTGVPAGATTSTELYFWCDDLEEAIQRLESAGARVLSPSAPRDWGDTAAYFADPSGNVLVLARPTGAAASP